MKALRISIALAGTLAISLLALGGCVNGVARYSAEPVMLDGEPVCCRVEVANGKEIGHLKLHLERRDGFWMLDLEETNVAAFRGQEIAAGAAKSVAGVAAKAVAIGGAVLIAPIAAPAIGAMLAAPGLGAAAAGVGAGVLINQAAQP